MTEKQRKILIRIIVGAVLYVAALFVPFDGMLRFCAFLVPFAVLGWDVVWKACRNILHGQIFDENFLMALASIGAFVCGEYPEAAAVMLFYQVGELFQSYAVGKSRKSIAALMDIRAEYANLDVNGTISRVAPEEVAVGSVIVVMPGERVPLDGIVLDGVSALNTSAITGESLPVDVEAGDDILSGCINQSGTLKVKTTKTYSDSTVARILELVENAAGKKAKTEKFITSFAKYYTPVVVICALLLAIVPPIFVGNITGWLYRAMIFLVISCPCALVISVPLSFFGGIGGASRDGILIKGSSYTEALSKAEIFVFDKTGTLTKGVFKVAAVHPCGCTEESLTELAALAEVYSNHPIATSLKEAYGMPLDESRVSSVREISGKGIEAIIDGKRVCVGNNKLMENEGAECHPCHKTGTAVHVALDGLYLGHIVISDEIKEDAADTISAIKAIGIKKTVMLTGDTDAVGRETAAMLGIDEVRTELLPEDKVTCMEEIIKQKSADGKVVYVGDGINDAPVISIADVGIAMGAVGSDAAIEAADIVLMDDNLEKIPKAIKISKRTLRIARQNICFALFIKAVVLIMGAMGAANMWEAVFADVGVSVIAILNAMRALKRIE